MTDEEIMLGIKYCHDKEAGCDYCPYAIYLAKDCDTNLMKDALDIINRQQAEIERLKQEQVFAKAHYGELEWQYITLCEALKTARVEAIKEFADKFDKVLAEMRDAYFEDDHVSYGLVCETVHARLSRFTKEIVGADNV